jgi:hypothetical protein
MSQVSLACTESEMMDSSRARFAMIQVTFSLSGCPVVGHERLSGGVGESKVSASKKPRRNGTQHEMLSLSGLRSSSSSPLALSARAGRYKSRDRDWFSWTRTGRLGKTATRGKMCS